MKKLREHLFLRLARVLWWCAWWAARGCALALSRSKFGNPPPDWLKDGKTSELVLKLRPKRVLRAVERPEEPGVSYYPFT